MTCESSAIRTGQSLYLNTSSLFDQLSGVAEKYCHPACHHWLDPGGLFTIILSVITAYTLLVSFSIIQPVITAYSLYVGLNILQELKFRLTAPVQQQLFFVSVFCLKCSWGKLERTNLFARGLLISSVVTKCTLRSHVF